jgi:hypothetical protein
MPLYVGRKISVILGIKPLVWNSRLVAVANLFATVVTHEAIARENSLDATPVNADREVQRRADPKVQRS